MRPALVEEVNARSQDLSETLQALRELSAAVDEYRTRVENMDENEAALFYRSVVDLRDEIASATGPDGLLSKRSELEEAVRSPLRQAASDAMADLLSLVDADLDDEVRTRTFDTVARKPPAELERAATSYRRLVARLDDADPVLRAALAERITARPEILQSPDDDLEPAVERLESRQQTLAELDSILADGDWTPKLDCAGTRRFYGANGDAVDPASVRADVDEIGAAVETLRANDIDVGAVLRDEIEDRHDDAGLAGVCDAIETYGRKLPAIAETYTNVAEFVRALDSVESASMRAEVESLQDSGRAVREYDYATPGDLERSVEEVADERDQFVAALHQRLRAQRAFADEIGIAASAQSPERLEAEPIRPSHVESDPAAALREYSDRQDRLTDHFDGEAEAVDHEQLVDIWGTLTDGGSVALTDENRESVLALADRLSLSVTLAHE